MLTITLFKYLLLFTFANDYPGPSTSPVIIQGQVVEKNTGKPVKDVHIYVLDGEEETLTNAKGEFSVRSWQKTPIKLTAEKTSHYHQLTIVIADPSEKQIIRLKKVENDK